MHETHRSNERGVAPVIAVVLMVAITVILAALIGFFVIDTGSSQQTTPQASFEFDYNGSHVIVEHKGGQGFDTENTASLEIRVNGTTQDSFDVSNEVTAGDDVAVSASTGDTITVVWVGPEAKQTDILDDYEVP